MFKIYIDCDGVILDTENGLFEKYEEKLKDTPDLTIGEFIAALDFETWLKKTPILKNSIDIIKSFPSDNVEILTHINSLGEGVAKVNFFRGKGITNNINLIPVDIPKNVAVNPKGNILIDDSHEKLDAWKECGGIPIYFGETDSYYPKTDDLSCVLDPSKRKKLLNEES